MKLQNKTAVITGGNSGIGLATALEMKEHGARVIIMGRNETAIHPREGIQYPCKVHRFGATIY